MPGPVPGRACEAQAVAMLAVCSVFCLASPNDSLGASFAGGTGEASDPYQVATAEQLISIGQDPNLLSRHFVLTADVDLDPNLPGRTVFARSVIAPLPEAPFAGSLDGQGHVVRNLVIATTAVSNDPSSLFGHVSPTGVVRNLGIVDLDIKGQWRSGTLIGANAGTLTSCHASGHVTMEGGDAGGLVWMNKGVISECTATVNVTTTSGRAGGLVVENQGNVIASHSEGCVTMAHGSAGGLIEYNSGGTVASCTSTCSVTIPGSTTGAGGLIGENVEGTVTACSSTGRVTVTGGGSNIGGLIGGNRGTVTSCHSSGSITVAGYTEGVGGLVGGNRGSLAKCSSTVKVSGTIHVGGLAGSNGAGYVVGCYSTGGVTGDRRIGGLLGSNGGIVTGCYSTAAVKGNEEVGGCIGENTGWIVSCYSAGGVCAGRTAKTVGGLVGRNRGLFATITSCYSISPMTCPNPNVAAGGGLVGDNVLGTITASYSLAPFDGGGPANGLCRILTANQMTRQGAFAGFDFWGTQADGLADDWFMPQGGRPVLAWQTDSDRIPAQGAAVQVAVGNGPYEREVRDHASDISRAGM